MDDREKNVYIRCFDTCRYELVWPTFFLEAPKATLRKIFKWLFMFGDYRDNEDTIEFFDREFPNFISAVEKRGQERIAAKEKVWRDRQADYEKEYLDPNLASFPTDWPKTKKRAEQKIRKERNARSAQRVKDAKTSYELAKKNAAKDFVRAAQVFELYQEVKNDYE